MRRLTGQQTDFFRVCDHRTTAASGPSIQASGTERAKNRTPPAAAKEKVCPIMRQFIPENSIPSSAVYSYIANRKFLQCVYHDNDTYIHYIIVGVFLTGSARERLREADEDAII